MNKKLTEQVEQIKKEIKTVHDSKEFSRTDVADALEDIAGEADALLENVAAALENGVH